jgi:LPLT family lysophospholipid transporter-like MFS transporter
MPAGLRGHWRCVLLLALYGLAAVLNLWVPDSGARYARASVHPRALWRAYWRAHRRLWADAEGGLSMAVTTLFWGAAAVLQFAVLRWASDVLGLPLDRAAYLQGAVAVGIVAGAALAGRWVPLAHATPCTAAGRGAGSAGAAGQRGAHWWVACRCCCWWARWVVRLVVPLNALLQHRGHTLLSAGRSIAVQNFNENASVLVMLAVYAACWRRSGTFAA